MKRQVCKKTSWRVHEANDQKNFVHDPVDGKMLVCCDTRKSSGESFGR